MRKYLLKFFDSALENQYQNEMMQRIQKPIFYCFIILVLFMNIAYLIENTLFGPYKDYYIQYTAISGAFGCIFIVRKYPYLIQYVLFVLNISQSLYQLNSNGYSDTIQESYSYGYIFSLLQTVIYFVSDFPIGVIAVIINFGIRVTLIIILTNKTVYLIILLNATSTILLVITLYISSYNSRQQFLMGQKENIFQQQIAHYVNKPHMILTFNQKFQMFNIIQQQQIKSFYITVENYCEGCNIREFLRKCIYQNSNLEDLLISQKIQLNESLFVRYFKQKIILRVCRFGINNDYIIILEKGIQDFLKKQLSMPMKAAACKYFGNMGKQHVMLQVGMFSVLLLNTLNLKNINVLTICQQLQKLFSLEQVLFIRKITNNNRKQLDEMEIITFANKFKIFFIQVFIILSQILKKDQRAQLILSNADDYFDIRIIIPQRRKFLRLYQSNLFIEQTQNYILYEQINKDLRLKLNRMISFQKTVSY